MFEKKMNSRTICVGKVPQLGLKATVNTIMCRSIREAISPSPVLCFPVIVLTIGPHCINQIRRRIIFAFCVHISLKCDLNEHIYTQCSCMIVCKLKHDCCPQRCDYLIKRCLFFFLLQKKKNQALSLALRVHVCVCVCEKTSYMNCIKETYVLTNASSEG